MISIKTTFKLAASLIICQLAGIIGSFFTSSSVNDWYVLIKKPSFTPPGSIIGLVWIIIFFLMGFSLYLIWQDKNKKAIIFFAIQLILNIFWSFFFFYLQSPLLALIEIIILWILILFTIIYSFRTSKLAGYLLIPYILWVSFATLLNFSIYYLNYIAIY